MISKKNLLSNYIHKYASILMNVVEIDILKQFNANNNEAEKEKNDVMNLALANKNEEAYALYNKFLSSLNQEIGNNFSGLTNYNIESVDKLSVENQTNYNKLNVIIIGVVLLALIIVLSVSIFTIILVTKPIKTLKNILKICR
jgi:methyl-accepting chemotaxis protein